MRNTSIYFGAEPSPQGFLYQNSTQIMIASLVIAKDWIPFNKSLAVALNSNNSAIMLAELCIRFSQFRTKNELIDDLFFPATIKSIEDEINLSKHQQSNCIKILTDHKLIECKLIGTPATRHFTIAYNLDHVLDQLTKENHYDQ